MATITALDLNSGSSATRQITKTALTGTDDLLVKSGRTQILVLENTGSGTPTINIDGDQATTFNCNGIDPVDVSGGYNIALAASGSAGDTVSVVLGSISAYTNDADNMPAVTGGTADVEAYILEK